MSQESSLTTPQDRDLENKWKPDQSVAPLSNEQTVEALKDLNISSFVEKFPKVDRTFAVGAVVVLVIFIVIYTIFW
jgi:hypothetical protein